MTMVMLPWVAKSAEGAGNGHWSFSVAKYGAQCSVDPFNTDAGNGVQFSSTCAASPVYLTADPNDPIFHCSINPARAIPPGACTATNGLPPGHRFWRRAAFLRHG